ncbi:MAG TPA: PEP-CTERM/exosortase system-associated acyltransferase [Micropepsaceae bacterium]|nr:PEP-CTERM/exosortase system-associated acyltransferase [Micropepsaceae bacterium]
MTIHSVLQFSQMNNAAPSLLNPEAIIASATRDDTLLERFNAHFEALPANTLALVRVAQKIRYQVYCIEHPHETADNPEGIETDEFDTHAAQSLLVHRATNEALGTVRLVLPLADALDRSFPVQRVLDETTLRTFNQLPLHSAAEVSRFSISRQFRRLADTYGRMNQDTFVTNSGPLMRLGLIQGLVRMSREHGITHWCAAMEPTLLRMLSAMAIRFRPVGPLIEYHGLRQPCYCVIDDALNEMKYERPAFWSLLTDGGALCDQYPMPARSKADFSLPTE